MKIQSVRKLILACAAVAAMASSGAHAEGFFAGIAKPFIGQQAADSLDNLHAQMGRPLDHAAAGFVDSVAPGAGRMMEANWALQRTGMYSPPAPAYREAPEYYPVYPGRGAPIVR